MSKFKFKRPASGNSKSSDSLANAAYRQKADDIVIEEEPSKEGRSFQDFLGIIYGVPKIGKTELLANIPGIYMLPTEPGYYDKLVRKTRINNWATFRKFVETMEKEPDKMSNIQMFGVDTADNLAKFCMLYVCGRDGINHPSDQE
jgi:hypothetical protein